MNFKVTNKIKGWFIVRKNAMFFFIKHEFRRLFTCYKVYNTSWLTNGTTENYLIYIALMLNVNINSLESIFLVKNGSKRMG